MGLPPNLVGRGSQKTARFIEASVSYLFHTVARPLNVPSRGLSRANQCWPDLLGCR